MEWETPHSMPRQNLQHIKQLNQPQVENSLLPSSIAGVERNMSKSVDDDIPTHDSGNESTPKSLASAMEAEAGR